MKIKCFLFFILIITVPLKINAQYKLLNAFPYLTFNQPLDFQDPRDGTNRVFVVTQDGIIYVFENNPAVTSKKVFLDIRNKLISGGEMGLLGLAFHPDFKKNVYFYVNYTAPSPLHTVIARFSVDKINPDLADVKSELIILEVNQPYQNHNAGQLAFGPDGYLYIGFGDGGSGGDPENRAQNNSALLGKMLRIDVNKTSNGKNYSIPNDNPFVGNTKGWQEEIWAYGLRNPWRYSFDTITGWLWIADVGQDKWEEVDIIKKGNNYGWRIMEGFHCYNPSTDCDTTGLILPIWEYGHNETGGNSITGGYVYRGKNLPDLYGKYIYGDFVSGRIWALEYDGIHPAKNELLLESRTSISSFGIDRNNSLFVCSYDGKIYKIIETNPAILSREIPLDFALYDIIVNQLDSRTPIVADIKNKGEVKLEIFDVSGKKIQTLFDDYLAAGKYKFYWNTKNLSGGIYIYQLTAGDKKIAKKMVLQK
jgi:glucose/arabinose dehydrogenase